MQPRCMAVRCCGLHAIQELAYGSVTFPRGVNKFLAMRLYYGHSWVFFHGDPSLFLRRTLGDYT